MKFKWIIGIVSVLLIMLSSTLVSASRLRLRPLSSAEVYRLLKEAGREDAVPEGRIVTQGIAAISGLALGIKTGIAIPLAIGVATSNATQQFLSNINYTAITASLPTIPPITLPTFNVTAITSNLPTINMTALTNLFVKPSSSNTATATVQYTTQEICFNSRSLNEIDDADGDSSSYGEETDAAGRQATGTTTTGTGGTTTGNTPTSTTTATSPTTTNVGTGTGGVTTTDDGDGTATDTQTTTETGTGGSVNCIVIQKPIVG